MANIEESENKSGSQLKLVVSIAVLSICISVVTSSIVVKTLVPTLPTSTSGPISVIASDTLTSVPTLQTPPSATPTVVKPQMPEIESNLLENNGFEDGLSNWVYLDKQAGFFTYEITGVNGKGFCSRRYVPLTTELDDLVKNEWEGISQEVLIDPNQRYFFSGWVKLNKAFRILALAEFYDGARHIGYAVLSVVTPLTDVSPDGETTHGWFFIHGEIPIIPPGTNRARVGLRHGIINNPPKAVDSTFCVDDLVFGQIVK